MLSRLGDLPDGYFDSDNADAITRQDIERQIRDKWPQTNDPPERTEQLIGYVIAGITDEDVALANHLKDEGEDDPLLAIGAHVKIRVLKQLHADGLL